MKVRKFHLLGFVAALVALIGVAAFDSRPAAAQATATKVCSSTPFTCTLTITAGAVAIPAGTITVTLTGNATYSSAVLSGTCLTAPAGPVTLAPVVAGSTTLTLTVGAGTCITGETIILSETLTATGVGGGLLSQALTGVETTTAVATAVVGGAPFVVPAPVAATPATATKTCAGATGALTFTCTLTITGAVAPLSLVSINIVGNATFASVTLGGTCAGVATFLGFAGGPRLDLAIGPAGCAAGQTIIVNETLNRTGTGGGPLTQNITGGGLNLTATATDFVVPGPAATTVAIICDPTTLNPGFGGVPSQPVPPSGATAPPNPATGGAAGTAGVLFSLCRLDFNDNGPTPATVSSGLVVITVQGGAAANAVTLFSNPAAPDAAPQLGPTNQLRINCPPPSSGARTPAIDSCDTVSFFVTLRQGVDPAIGPFGAVLLRVTYDPDVDAANTGLTTDLAGPTVAPPASPGLRQPGFRVVCTSSVDPAFGLGLSPGQLPLGTVLGDTAATGAPFAIGTLPGGIPCQIQADFDLSTTIVDPSAPGTIEVSALSGGLLDASGRFSTNLRIGCGDVPSLAAGVINLNTCVGVRFTVFGAGVGLVEIRFRYEPAAIAQAAGILEDEGAFTVGFVAPRADVSLLLNPNPVTVGATGTATARFNRTGLCATGVVCIDPTTGLPITVTAGTVLNGTVVFTIDNSAIASFVGAQTATTTPVSSTGFVTSANQATVRCGFFPTTQAPTQFTLGNFFGGCFEVAATYRGNAPGVANVAATFTPDLPSASSLPFFTNVFAPTITNVRALEVVGAAPVGDVQLARGCNNVSPTVTEAAAAYAARVNPSSALVAIWEHQAATNTFRGYSPQQGAPNDLSGVTRLRPVFVCTSGAAVLAQPAA